MVDDRPEKRAMRELWADYVEAARDVDSDAEHPWYLTLPGAEARDIRLLVERKIIGLTENDSIAEEDSHKITAIEADQFAQDRLRDFLPGVRSASLSSLLGGHGMLTYPTPKQREGFRAHVVNLDFNGSLDLDNKLSGRKLAYIDKIAEMHREPEPMEWVLCVTLSAAINWDEDTVRALRKWLQNNFKKNPDFAEHARELLDEQTMERLEDPGDLDLGTLPAAERQRLLLAVVPKAILWRQVNKGWRIVTEHSLLYGNDETTHPMVSFVMRFKEDAEAITQPQAVYAESLSGSLSEASRLSEQGKRQALL